MHPQRARRAGITAFFVQGACFAVLLTRIPALKDRFGLSDGQLALVLLVVPVVAGLGSLLAGSLAGRHGSARVIRVAAPCVCLGLAAIGAAPTLPLLFAVLAAFAVALGAVDATMNMQGVAVQDAYGRSIMSSFHAAFSLAGILGSLLAAGAARLHWPLGGFFSGVAVLGIAASLAAGPSLIRVDVAAGQPSGGHGAGAVVIPVALPWRPILLIGVAVTCLYIGDSTVSNWSAVYLTDVLHSSDSVAALAYGGYATAMLLGRLGGDAAVEWYGVVNVIRIGSLVAAAGVAVVIAAPWPAFGLAGFVIMGLGLCVVAPQSFTAAAKVDPTGSGAAVARVNAFNYVGFVLGAPLVGLVGDGVGTLRVGFVVPMLLVLVIGLFAPAFDPAPIARNGLPTMKP
jgi:predicted MFS family arabinose efflux permease